MDTERDLELYIHIPFCVKKCKYCDFLSAPAARQVQKAYMEALLQEIRGRAGEAFCAPYRVCSIFIGGGTPSVVEPEWIGKLLGAITTSYRLTEDAEISMEVNPGTVTRQSLAFYKRAGINRLSIGLQSADDAELKCLGRIHDYAQFLDAYRWAREEGFTNINVDLMSAIPNQTIESLERTLRKILQLTPPPEHISMYSLIVEEGTDFYKMQEKGALVLPDEDAEREMYWKMTEILQNEGYEHYEISNYARKGFACRHNCGYWQRTDYLGFGTGAASLINNMRFHNGTLLEKYIEDPLEYREDVQQLGRAEQMAETMFLGLRMACGVDGEEFRRRFGVALEEVYQRELQENVAEGLLQVRDGRYVLTRRGVDLSNYCMAKFLADEEKSLNKI